MVNQQVKSYLFGQWTQRVHQQFLYRGMNAKDLTDPLNPAHLPYAPIRSDLCQLIFLLNVLLDAGFQYAVREEDSGQVLPLGDIVQWTSYDLAHPGLDFTSGHESARGYARQYHGSRLRQHFREITEQLPGRKHDPIMLRLMTSRRWALVERVHRWCVQSAQQEQSVVLWVRRSCSAFEDDRQENLLLGSFDYFLQRVTARLAEQRLPATVKAVARILPPAAEPVRVRLTRPLYAADIVKMETEG